MTYVLRSAHDTDATPRWGTPFAQTVYRDVEFPDLDALFAGITNAVMQTLPNFQFADVNAVSNYFFNITSSIVLGIVAGFIIDKVIEKRMWQQEVPTEEHINLEEAAKRGDRDENGGELSAELSTKEMRGLIFSVLAAGVVTAVILFAALIPDSPWRNETGGYLPKSPLLSSIVFIVFLNFLVMGIVYGRIVGTVNNVKDVVDMMIGSLKDMLSFLVLAFILGQFVGLFAWTGIGTFTAVHGAAFL